MLKIKRHYYNTLMGDRTPCGRLFYHTFTTPFIQHATCLRCRQAMRLNKQAAEARKVLKNFKKNYPDVISADTKRLSYHAALEKVKKTTKRRKNKTR